MSISKETPIVIMTMLYNLDCTDKAETVVTTYITNASKHQKTTILHFLKKCLEVFLSMYIKWNVTTLF